MVRRLALLLCCAAATACIQLDAELPELCRTSVINVQVPANAKAAPTAMQQDADFLPQDADQLTTLSLQSGSLAIQPAGAFDELKLVLHPPAGSAAPDLTLLSLSPAGAGGVVEQTGTDLLPYVGGHLTFEAVGTPQAATLTVDLCASAAISKQLSLSP